MNKVVVIMEEKKKKKGFTSIRIDPDLWKEVKIEAIRRDMRVSELVERALRKEVDMLRKMSEVKER
jgi:predicted HicB family RNase H-like nuclease